MERPLTEKEAIERATADSFLPLYNSLHGETYRVVEHADAPDIRCANDAGDPLGLEITLTEDCPEDIKALLGRSEHRSLDALRRSRRPGPDHGRFPPANSLSDSVAPLLASRIAPKLTKDYGRRVALVVRDTSGVDWPWEAALDDTRALLDLSRNPFEKGIWLLNSRMSTLYRIA